MSQLIELIAHSYNTLERLARVLSDQPSGPAHVLLEELELQLVKIDAEAAHLKQQNIEMHHQLGLVESSSMHIPQKAYPRMADRGAVRQTMQVVSQFYQRYTPQGQYRKVG